MDLTAEFFLQTIDTAFVKQALPKGEVEHAVPVNLAAIRRVRMPLVEGPHTKFPTDPASLNIFSARGSPTRLCEWIVLENEASFTPLLVERKTGETQLFVKQVKIEGKRYIVCRNEAEAEKDRMDREAIVAALDAQLKKATRRSSAPRPIDGIYARSAKPRTHDLRTNAKVTPLQAALRYRDLLQVENLFLCTKAIMRTRPIFHSSDAAIRGHVFCFFLALAMQEHPDDLSGEVGATPEWKDLLRDLDRLQHVRLAYRGDDRLVRMDATPNVAALFRHAHIALPPRAGPV